MATRKRIARTSKIEEVSEDFEKVLKFAKKFHRADEEFYISSFMYDGEKIYSNYSKSFIDVSKLTGRECWHYTFNGSRWECEYIECKEFTEEEINTHLRREEKPQ